jgi:hypothetical protein
MYNFSVADIIKVLHKKEYAIFTNDISPFNLNIVGIRATHPKVNAFNDVLNVFWYYKGHLNVVKMDCTTLAGLYYLEKPCNPKGCAILKAGQYRSTYELGLHNGKYEALCQRLGEVTVYRDNDKDVNYDMIDATEETGYFGINIHRANAKDESPDVNTWSAGCQVIQNPHNYDVFMQICRESSEIWGNSFTYTLLDESDFE